MKFNKQLIIIDTDIIFKDIVSFLGLEFSNRIYNKIKKLNKIPRQSTNIVDGYWKRYTINNVSRSGDSEYKMLGRIKKLVDKKYFQELDSLRSKYSLLKKRESTLNRDLI